MKTKLLFSAGVLLALVFGLAGGLYPLITVGPELVAAKKARLEAERLAEPDAPWGFWTIEVEALALELRESRRALVDREAELDARESQLDAELSELHTTRRQIEAMRRNLEKLMTRIEANEAKNLRGLAKTYTALQPAAAVAILSEMDDATVVKILALMKPEAVADIFNQIGVAGAGEPEAVRRAANLSEKLRLFDRSEPGAR